MRIRQNRFKYSRTDLYRWIKGQQLDRGLKQKEIAEELGIDQSNFSKKIRTGNLSFEEMVRLFETLEATDEDIIKIMRPQISC